MATPQNFRSAFNGFNRDDVVNYISFITTKHETQVNQLNTELDQLRQELSERPEAPAADESELTALREQVAQLQADLQQRDELIAHLQTPAPALSAAVSSVTEEELNAYRRAESAERRAMERVNQMYAKAHGILADAMVQVEDNDRLVSGVAQKVWNDLDALRDAVTQSKSVLTEAASTIAAIGPEE